MLWADEIPPAQILKQMRALGMKQRVFGSYRTLGPELLAEAGPAAEGFEAVFPYDPTRNDPHWLDFNRRFEARFNEQPEQFASLAYDAMNALLDSICKAGLNRARIHDALADIEQYDGVTGHMVFDPNQKNVAPMYLGTVHNGAITYNWRRWTSGPAGTLILPRSRALHRTPQAPYARVGEDGVISTARTRRSAAGTRARRVLRAAGGGDCAVGRGAGAVGRSKKQGGSGNCFPSTATKTGERLQRNWYMR